MAYEGKYHKLHNYLIQFGQHTLELSFSAIEKILGFDLPPSAYKHQAWWANTKSHPIALTWLKAGYLSERVNLVEQTVVFTKTDVKSSERRQCKVYQNNSTMTADTAVRLIRNYYSETLRDPHGRYMSWRHCYRVFSENRNVTDEHTIDCLSLHLAFYLASWGMYRGSSFLLQKDYKVHIPIVEVIQEKKYDPLHGISAKALCEEENLDLLMEIAKRIRDCYERELPSAGRTINNTSDTLVTKILLGTLGCVPAFDGYYVESVKKHGVSEGVFNKNSVRKVAEFYCDDLEVFENLRHELSECGIEYPPMKLIDMCFWQDTKQKKGQAG